MEAFLIAARNIRLKVRHLSSTGSEWDTPARRLQQQKYDMVSYSRFDITMGGPTLNNISHYRHSKP